MYPEAQIGGGHYLMMEIDLAHRCGEMHCSDSGITECHKDGYLTTVDGRCGCKCSFPGLDPPHRMSDAHHQLHAHPGLA